MSRTQIQYARPVVSQDRSYILSSVTSAYKVSNCLYIICPCVVGTSLRISNGPCTSPDGCDQSDNQPHADHPRIRSIRANHILLSNYASGGGREAIVSSVDLSVPAHNTHVT